MNKKTSWMISVSMLALFALLLTDGMQQEREHGAIQQHHVSASRAGAGGHAD